MPYLEEFLKSIASLPSEFKDNYSELRKLDESFQEYEKQLENQFEEELEEAKKACESDSMLHAHSFSRKITETADICKDIADQKIKLATQTYKRVDGHIRRLDKYLKKLDQELKRETEVAGGLSGVEQRPEVSNPVGNEAEVKAIQKKRQQVEQPVSMDLDLPVDPNEPTYCICNRVFFGEMVACDNDNCKIEWFHYECVGITDPPKGKWYCPDCAPKMKQRRRG